MIAPQDDRAIYRQVADDLRKRIAAGELRPGDDLPVEAALAAQYSIGKDAVRDALALLVAGGLVEKRRGHPSRVRHTPPMATVDVPPGHLIGARAATAAESCDWGIPEHAPVLVLIEEPSGVEVDAWPADRTRLRAAE